jgi:hypothetical protein
MKKSQKKTVKGRPAAGRSRVLRAAVLACALLAAGAVTAIARYESPAAAPHSAKQPAAPARAANNYVTVEVGGKRIQVNALALQQGPLAQEQSQQIVDALKDNQSTDGLAEVKHPDGSVSMDLQGRFQDVVIAKKNDDGSVSTACVDNAEAASAFLRSTETTATVSNPTRKAALQQ